MRCVRLVQRSQGLPGNGDGPLGRVGSALPGSMADGMGAPAHATNRPALANRAPAILEPERRRRNSAVITGGGRSGSEGRACWPWPRVTRDYRFRSEVGRSHA